MGTQLMHPDPAGASGAAFIYLQLQGIRRSLKRVKATLSLSPDPDISEMCVGHLQTLSRLARFERVCSYFFPCVMNIFNCEKDVEVRFRRTWAPESLRTSQGV